MQHLQHPRALLASAWLLQRILVTSALRSTILFLCEFKISSPCMQSGLDVILPVKLAATGMNTSLCPRLTGRRQCFIVLQATTMLSIF